MKAAFSPTHVAKWMAENDTWNLIRNANHYRRRWESAIGQDIDQRMAVELEDEIARRMGLDRDKPFDPHTATISEILQRWRKMNQHRAYAAMSDAELTERAIVFRRLDMARPELKAELEKRGLSQ